MKYYLEFEKPLQEMELKIEELRRLSNGSNLDIASEIAQLEEKTEKLITEIYGNLSPWQRTLVARHQDRPYTLDYIEMMAEDFVELRGDRRFADDPALVGGFCRIGEESVMVIGHQKGRGVKSRIQRNFGQPNPEGYRKALRLMHMAEKFGRPVVTLIDTPGAYPGLGAEERGQAEAIAVNLMEMSRLSVPILSIVIGEGGSGGALAISVSDRLFMLENSVYSVISPEGCAAILWKKNGELNAESYSKAADALRITAQDLYHYGIADGIVPEPVGGAHRDPKVTAQSVKDLILKTLPELKKIPVEDLLDERYHRLRHLGSINEGK